jgi:hypothetical protein
MRGYTQLTQEERYRTVYLLCLVSFPGGFVFSTCLASFTHNVFNKSRRFLASA